MAVLRLDAAPERGHLPHAAGGWDEERLTTDPADDFAPDLSPDGREVAYHLALPDRGTSSSGRSTAARRSRSRRRADRRVIRLVVAGRSSLAFIDQFVEGGPEPAACLSFVATDRELERAGGSPQGDRRTSATGS